MHSDFELSPNGETIPSGRSWGGARENAGRKPAGYVKPEHVVDFEKERARNEKAKADLNELEFQIKSGQYVPRDAVRQAAATAFASVAQSLRSIPDSLERKINLDPGIAEKVGEVIDEVLDSLASDLEMMTNDD